MVRGQRLRMFRAVANRMKTEYSNHDRKMHHPGLAGRRAELHRLRSTSKLPEYHHNPPGCCPVRIIFCDAGKAIAQSARQWLRPLARWDGCSSAPPPSGSARTRMRRQIADVARRKEADRDLRRSAQRLVYSPSSGWASHSSRIGNYQRGLVTAPREDRSRR